MMNRSSHPFSRSCRGATLIEVLAGLVLLGTILSSALVARGRFMRQWRVADEKLTAVAAADRMLGQWLSEPPGAAPVPGEGAFAQSPELRWRTSWLRDAAAERLGVRMARLDVFRSRGSHEPLVSIGFLLRPPVPTTQRINP